MTSFLRAFLTRRMLCVFALGFSSGLPFLLIGSTLKAWLTDINVDLAIVGVFTLARLPYSFKFVWAPLMDRFVPPFLDRRRGWILICQLAISATLVLLAFSNPEGGLTLLSLACGLLGFIGASQDIVIDAYRRDVLQDEEQGLGASLAVNGYRIGLLIAGAGALFIAQYASWKMAYLSMAVAIAAAGLVTILSPPLSRSTPAPATLIRAVVDPFKDFLGRPRAFEILAFILLFKLGEQLAADMLNPFYLQIGYEKAQIAAISKVFGLWATIGGGILGGIILLRVNIYRCLWIFGFLQMVALLGFAWLGTLSGPNLTGLAITVTLENVTSGMATSAYVAFMAQLTNRQFTATQYALLTSMMSLSTTLIGSSAGWIAKTWGWPHYFIFCMLVAIPGLLLLLRSPKWTEATTYP